MPDAMLSAAIMNSELLPTCRSVPLRLLRERPG